MNLFGKLLMVIVAPLILVTAFFITSNLLLILGALVETAMVLGGIMSLVMTVASMIVICDSQDELDDCPYIGLNVDMPWNKSPRDSD